MANSAVLGVMPYPWDREDQGKQTASRGRMDRDLVRKYRYFWGGVKNLNRWVSPHVVHRMLAEVSVMKRDI